MSYKGEYNPSDLLDPETYEWNPLDQNLKKLLDESKYVSPSANRTRQQPGDGQVATEADEDTTENVGVADEEGEISKDEADSFIFDTKMPGLLTDQQLKAFDISNVKIKVAGVQARAKVVPRV